MTSEHQNPNVQVRPAVADDAEVLGRFGKQLTDLHHELDAKRFISTDSATAMHYARFLKSQVDKPDVIVLVAELDGAIAGYVYGGIEGTDYMSLRGPAGVIHDIFVDPACRQKGIGRMLVEAVVAAINARGMEQVVLSTAYRNAAAQRLFTAVGFRPTMLEMTRSL